MVIALLAEVFQFLGLPQTTVVLARSLFVVSARVLRSVADVQSVREQRRRLAPTETETSGAGSARTLASRGAAKGISPPPDGSAVLSTCGLLIAC
jgi:hypothetical protein